MFAYISKVFTGVPEEAQKDLSVIDHIPLKTTSVNVQISKDIEPEIDNLYTESALSTTVCSSLESEQDSSAKDRVNTPYPRELNEESNKENLTILQESLSSPWRAAERAQESLSSPWRAAERALSSPWRANQVKERARAELDELPKTAPVLTRQETPYEPELPALIPNETLYEPVSPGIVIEYLPESPLNSRVVHYSVSRDRCRARYNYLHTQIWYF